MKGLRKIGGALAVFTGGAVAKPAETVRAPWVPPSPAPWVPTDPAAAGGGRLVFGFDATASRSGSWPAAQRLQDSLLGALPGQLDVALTVHSGGKLERFTRFTSDPGKLRDMAAGVVCKSGGTRLLDMLGKVNALGNVDVVLYVGDLFEESSSDASRIAAKLASRKTRVIILQEGRDPCARGVFAEIADATGGALLPFDISSVARVKELTALVQAVAVLAVGDVDALKLAAPAMPAATLLLGHINAPKALGGRVKQ